MNKKGFTLLELLVVVLIIGILAAIALPQYKMAVGKSRYAALKNATKTLKSAADRYYLTNNELPTKLADLDVSFSIKRETSSTDFFSLQFTDGMSCDVYNSSPLVFCYKTIVGKDMYYWINNSHCVCYAGSADTTDIGNRICQQETNKTAQDCQLSPSGGFCRYYYY